MARRLSMALLAAVLVVAGACGDGDEPSDQPTEAAGCPADAVELDDGLCYVEHEAGNGPEAEEGDVVEVDYTGKLTDGTVFDSSEGGRPIKFALGAGEVIEGWDLGIQGMKVGGSRTLTIPPDLAYGEAGFPDLIPPDATLIFDVELVSIKSSKG